VAAGGDKSRLANGLARGGHLLQFLGDGGDLLHAILVGGQVRLKGFVLLLQGLQLVELALAEVLRLQHFLLAARPVLVGIGLWISGFSGLVSNAE